MCSFSDVTIDPDPIKKNKVPLSKEMFLFVVKSGDGPRSN